jgi:ribosomal protein L7/L12
MNNQDMERVKQLAKNRRMIDAIKLYRELTGCGLREAKTAVEALARGETPSAPRPQMQRLDMDEVMRWLRAGRKIEAIKVYREMTGVGLREAKEAVDALERGEQVPTPTRTVGQYPADIVTQIEALIPHQKIMAIKLYREHTGVGLKSAKDAVEAIARGDSVGWQSRVGQFDLEHVKQLIRSGRKIDAMIYYRQQLGLAPEDARAIVDTLEEVMASGSTVL